MKTIATIVLTLMLGGALVAPAAAADEAPAQQATCEQLLSESQHRESVLHDYVAAYQVVAEVSTKDLRRADQKIKRQRATIKRLRAQLAAAR